MVVVVNDCVEFYFTGISNEQIGYIVNLRIHKSLRITKPFKFYIEEQKLTETVQIKNISKRFKYSVVLD